ncbi:Ltp family lipoprotein [Lentibacillus jeotgali]|uniref:Ltp family lipoprotein n=1 Tax=Lentibacillus jeotgali TaxID=558169 RepID=UPI000262601E|nr:Ltp family lipoprotein [Lentibacillus jeotgali]
MIKKVLKFVGYGFLGLIALGIVVSIFSDGEVEQQAVKDVEATEETEPTTEPETTEPTENENKEKPTESKEEPTEVEQNDKANEVEEEPSMTVSQQNAVGSAETYIQTMAFSKSGLIEQLKFDGYPEEDAKFAVENIEVNWKKQAVKSAKTYLDTMSFSRQGLIDQLKFDGYSKEHANHAADQVGF